MNFAKKIFYILRQKSPPKFTVENFSYGIMNRINIIYISEGKETV